MPTAVCPQCPIVCSKNAPWLLASNSRDETIDLIFFSLAIVAIVQEYLSYASNLHLYPTNLKSEFSKLDESLAERMPTLYGPKILVIVKIRASNDT